MTMMSSVTQAFIVQDFFWGGELRESLYPMYSEPSGSWHQEVLGSHIPSYIDTVVLGSPVGISSEFSCLDSVSAATFYLPLICSISMTHS